MSLSFRFKELFLFACHYYECLDLFDFQVASPLLEIPEGFVLNKVQSSGGLIIITPCHIKAVTPEFVAEEVL